MGDLSLTALKKLGFGLMRLPKFESGEYDMEQIKEMIDLFMEAGFNYFDTAFVYDNGGSECAAKEVLVQRYPRESFYLASKLCAWWQNTDEQAAKQQIYTSLERTGAGYLDFYLLHAIGDDNYRKYDEFRLWDYVRELKEKGLIRHYGFSFHGTPELLDALLTAHPDVEFIQLQVNYADLENPDVQSRRCMEVARLHEMPFIVMEPVKGGGLAALPPEAETVFRRVHPAASMASWAIRFAASQENVITVLSGMSNLQQIRDNLSYMTDFSPLGESEREAVARVRTILCASQAVPCTACRYCVDGCPRQIPIPDIFAAMNLILRDKKPADEAKAVYAEAVDCSGRASDCVACGQCESACPQQIGIIDKLCKAAAMLE